MRANTEKLRDCHLVARTCDNEVGVAISIRDPYTSPFTSRCKFARCLLLVRCLCSETVYPCRSCEIPRSHVRANTEKMRDCHLVARTCDNEVGVAISIRDPYTSPFTSRCKFARCLLLVRCLCSETVAIGFLISVEPNFVERTALGSLKRRRSYSR